MAIHLWNSLIVDNIAVTKKIVSKEDYSALCGMLYDIKKNKVDMAPNAKKIIISKEEYSTTLHYYPASGDISEKIADIRIGTTMSKHRYLRLGLYPSKFQVDQFWQFQEMTDVYLQDYGYKSLYANGKVTYAEFAADSRTHMAHSFIPFGSYFGESDIYDGDTSVKGTAYLGSKQSDLRFAIYDKTKQLIETQKTPKYKIHTRFEVRLRSKKLLGMNIPQLANLPNPLERLEIAELPKALGVSQDVEWQQFIAECLKLGSALALKFHPKRRKEFIALLRQCAPIWWTPSWHWKDIDRAVAALAPM